MATPKNHFSKWIAIALPVGLILAPSVALADDAASSTASFQTQYQQNVNTENSLMQQAKNLSVTDLEILTLNYRVQVLNYRINQLYTEEQKLAATPSATSSPQPSTRQQLISERNQLLSQLRSLWKNTFGIGAGAGLQVAVGNGDDRKGPKGWGHGKNDDKRVTLNQLLHLNQSRLANWLSTIASDFGEFRPGHGHGDSDRQSNRQPVSPQDLSNAITQMTQLIAQIGQVDASLAQWNQGGDEGQGDEGQGDEGHGKESDRLGKIQQEILHLQNAAIQDLTRWIKLGGATPVTTDNTVTGLQVTVNASNVTEAGHVTYTAQVVNATNQPVHVAGVKVDFAISANGSDGTLAQMTAITDANGQASVDAVAGNAAGSLIVSAQIDSSTLPGAVAPTVTVQGTDTTVTKLVAAGSPFPTSLSIQQNTGANVDVYPETAVGNVVAGDQLRISTSNPTVLALPTPDASSSDVETLNVGDYAIPALQAKSVGTATVTITDLTAPLHPSLQYTVQVSDGAAVGLVAINPDGSMNHSYPVSAGSDGPFQIAVVNAAGAEVPAPSNIELSQAQVNAIIGAGNAVRPANAANEVPSVMIFQGQSSVTVYADGVTAGQTHPTEFQLSALSPSPVSGNVVNGNTITLTFNQALNGTLPLVSDFTVNWGAGTSTPQSVSIAGNTLTLTLWGNVIQHGDTVTVAYNPLASDANALAGVFGQKVAAFSSAQITNSL